MASCWLLASVPCDVVWVCCFSWIFRMVSWLCWFVDIWHCDKWVHTDVWRIVLWERLPNMDIIRRTLTAMLVGLLVGQCTQLHAYVPNLPMVSIMVSQWGLSTQLNLAVCLVFSPCLRGEVWKPDRPGPWSIFWGGGKQRGRVGLKVEIHQIHQNLRNPVSINRPIVSGTCY